jgi:hypothetical protein
MPDPVQHPNFVSLWSKQGQRRLMTACLVSNAVQIHQSVVDWSGLIRGGPVFLPAETLNADSI